MADPISLTSGLLALVVFALQSSKTLYETFESFQNSGRNIRELKTELAALNEVLQSLQETVNQNDTKLSALKLPLLSCGKACTEFTGVVAKCTTHSAGSRSSFRDWARLSYMGKDIAGFRSLMAGYKSTITIALGDANIRTAIVTAELLNEYKEMIQNTTADLEELLHGIDDRIKSEYSGVPRNPANTDDYRDDESTMEEERASIQQCLKICEDVSGHIGQVQASGFADITTPSGSNERLIKLGGVTPAQYTTSTTLENCKRGLGVTSSQLKIQLDDLNNRIARFSQKDTIFDDHAPGNQKMKEELDSIKECLAICTTATEQITQERVHVFEDVNMADDGQQVIVATMGDLISAKRVTVGARSTQWLGQMSDASLQQISKDRHGNGKAEGTGRDTEKGAQFEGRHGSGRKLR